MTPFVAMLVAIVIPLVAVPLIGLLRHHPNIREAVTLVAACALIACVLPVYSAVSAGDRPSVVLLEMLPGVAFILTAEPLGVTFAGIASILWLVTSVYSIGYMRGHGEHYQTRFYIFFAIAIAATMGVAFSGNVLTLFTFYEMLTLSTFPLVTHAGTEEAKRAGRVYLGILLGTSIGFQLPAVALTWLLTGNINFEPGGIVEGYVPPAAMGILLALYVFGIGKAALMPFHRWLPAAMVAPTPVSALLHAVAVVKAGVFTILKVIVYVFGIDVLQANGVGQWLIYVAGFTIVTASLIALRQDNLKRRLAYSTIGQLSYIVLATAVLMPTSVVGATFHIAAHAFGKITLFFAAGAILVAAHKTEVSQLAGIGRRMPWTMGTFAIACLSMIGVPPTAGFVSKWFMAEGAWQAGDILVLAVMMTSTLLNASYYLPIVHAAFFRRELAPLHDGSHGPGAEKAGAAGHHNHGEAPLPMVLAMVFTATGTLVLFFLPDTVLTLARQMIGIVS